MRLIMEVERQFDITLPSHLLSELRSYDNLATALAQVNQR
jgi:acyl carrier protein